MSSKNSPEFVFPACWLKIRESGRLFGTGLRIAGRCCSTAQRVAGMLSRKSRSYAGPGVLWLSVSVTLPVRIYRPAGTVELGVYD